MVRVIIKIIGLVFVVIFMDCIVRYLYVEVQLCLAYHKFCSFISILADYNSIISVFYFVTKNVNFCDKWYMNKNFTLTLSSIVLILPLCFSKKIDFLKYAR